MWGNPTLLNYLRNHWEKTINNSLRKVNIDRVNRGKPFDRSAAHK